MEIVIEALISEIKKDTRYLSFLIQEKKMQDATIQTLLKEYQEAINTYQEVKKYALHIDISKQEMKMKQLKQEISQHPVIQEYYEAYHQINRLLEEVTKIIYQDISTDLSTSRYKL